jgi:hypothetical protein
VDNGVRVSRSGSDAVLRWNVAAGATTSAVLRGHVSGLPVGRAGADERCLVSNSLPTRSRIASFPSAAMRFGIWFEGRTCGGSGPYGFEELHGVPVAPRLSATCP